MRDLGAEFVRVGEVWVKFPKTEKEAVAQVGPSVSDGHRARGHIGREYTAGADSALQFEEHSPASELDDSDRAELANRAAAKEQPMDTLEWFKSEPLPVAE